MKRIGLLLTLSLCLAGNTGKAQDRTDQPQVIPQFSPQSKAPARGERDRSMKVIDARSARTSQVNHFTVVGAVDSSAVFTSNEPRLSVGDLIEAAGGLAPEASGSVRIVNQGRSRTQFIFGQDNKLAVYPGEIVVVVPRINGPMASDIGPIIPVVCLGLASHPVVLPLDQRLQSVPKLVQQLRQPTEVAAKTRVLHPLGPVGGGELAPGAILAFDPASLDQNGLQMAQQFDPMPEPVPFGEAPESELPKVTPGTPGALSSPDRDSSDLALAPESSGSETALQAMEVTDLPPPLTATADSAPTPLFSNPQPTPFEPLAEAAAPVQQPAALTLIPEPFVSEFKPSPVTVAAVPNTAEQTSWIYRDKEPEPTLAEPVSDSSAANAELEPFPMDVLEAEALEPANASMNFSGLWAIATGIGLLALACFGLCVVWSRWEDKAALNAVLPETAAKPMPAPPVPAFVEAPQPEAKTPLEQLVDPDLKVVEEPVAIAASTVVHGEPVGHRAMYVHEAHASVSKPHFLKQRNRGTATANVLGDERRLREDLRSLTRRQRIDADVMLSVDGETADPVDMEPPVEERVRPEYDVVQPEPASVSRGGALERVLRAHNREARG